MKYLVAGLLSAVAFAISFFFQAAMWVRLYAGLEPPIFFFVLLSVVVGAFFFLGYAVADCTSGRTPVKDEADEWKPVRRSIDEHGAEFVSAQEIRFRMKKRYPS
jgi:hypothetical protein